MKLSPAINEFLAGAGRNKKALILATLVGAITFVYLFFNSPFIPRVYVCDFSQPAQEPGLFLQYDTGYGFNLLQAEMANPAMPTPILKTYHPPIEYLEFDRINGRISHFSIDKSGDFYPTYMKRLKVLPHHYSPDPLIFKLGRWAVKSVTVITAAGKDVLPLDRFGKQETYLILYSHADGSIRLGISSRVTNLYYFRYLPLNLREFRVASRGDVAKPYALLIGGEHCRAVQGTHRDGHDYFPVDLAPFGHVSLLYTIACLVAALALALLIYLLRDPRGLYRLVTFSLRDTDRAITISTVLFALTACCYLALLYVFFPGLSAWDFPYNQVTHLGLSHWLSVYHSLFYVLMYVTFGFSGIFLVQILLTSYLLGLSASTWINGRLNKAYSTALLLVIGFSPPVAAYSVYFKRDILGGLFCAVAVTLAYIAFRTNRKALAWSYLFALFAVGTRIDYIFYLLALMALDIWYAPKRLRALGRVAVILVLATVVLHSVIPRLVATRAEKEEARYKIVALASYLHYAFTEDVLSEEEKKIFLDFYQVGERKFHINRDLRPEIKDDAPFRDLYLRAVLNHPGAFLAFCGRQFLDSLKCGFFEAAPSHQWRAWDAMSFGLIQPREGTYPYVLLKGVLSTQSLWSLVPSLILLVLACFTFRRTPVVSLFALACLVRYAALLPLAPGFRFFYAYDIYLIGLLSLGLLPTEWKRTAPRPAAEA